VSKKKAAKRKHYRPASLTRPRSPNENSAPRRLDFWIEIVLAVATIAVYAQVVGHQFISLDDDTYIRENPVVARGLSFSGVAWAFTTFHAANWHPLTWLSHMLDCQLFGLNAGGHLLVNALIHIANTLLLFWFLRRVTGAIWCSAMVAALFALHPMHVESVAWASERKDTLSAFFGLLSLLAYARYVEKRSCKNYAFLLISLGLGLMAKPMLVTWPIVLFLLDYWPFRRYHSSNGAPRFENVWPLIREKLPLFALAGASVVVTYFAQAHGGTVRTFTDAPLSLRLTNAIVSYAKYLFASFWPVDLAVYYPFPRTGIPAWQLPAAFLLLTALSLFAFISARSRPYVLIGWLWFLGTLVPVIGLMQVGGQAMADRYYYLPSIGLFVAFIFGLADLATTWRIGRGPLAAVSVAILLTLASLTAMQVARWRDSITLFTHTLAVTPDNLIIQYGVGHALRKVGRYEEALNHFAAALDIKPDFFDALMGMGMLLAEEGRAANAAPYFNRALRVEPDSGKAHMELGLTLINQNKKEAALQEFRAAFRLAPQDSDVRTNLGLILARNGETKQALEHLNEAVRLNPNSAEAHNNLGLVLLASGHPRESIAHFSAALRLNPQLTVAQQNLRRAEAQLAR
jgi:protein O-mannosyl-transferase